MNVAHLPHQRKTSWLALILLLTLALAACSAATNSAATPGADAAAQPAVTPRAPGAQPTSLPLQLALGTLKLEATPNAITPAQAAKLLPLWKAARSLGNSQTAAAQEIEAVFKQIQETLTAEQRQAIQAMDLSLQNLPALSAELGLELGDFGGGFNRDPNARATMQAARAAGQAPPGGEFGPGMGPGAGMGPGGGFGGGQPGADSGFSPEARQTALASGSTPRGAQLGLPPALLEAVIQYLERILAE